MNRVEEGFVGKVFGEWRVIREGEERGDGEWGILWEEGG